jgi:hypothetical protein
VIQRTLMLSELRCKKASKSTWKKAAAQLGISRWSVQWILKGDLNLYPYTLTLLPKLTVLCKHQRMAFSEWAQNNEVSFKNVWFSDEAQFHMWFMRRFIIHWELQCGLPSQVMDC